MLPCHKQQQLGLLGVQQRWRLPSTPLAAAVASRPARPTGRRRRGGCAAALLRPPAAGPRLAGYAGHGGAGRSRRCVAVAAAAALSEQPSSPAPVGGQQQLPGGSPVAAGAGSSGSSSSSSGSSSSSSSRQQAEGGSPAGRPASAARSKARGRFARQPQPRRRRPREQQAQQLAGEEPPYAAEAAAGAVGAAAASGLAWYAASPTAAADGSSSEGNESSSAGSASAATHTPTPAGAGTGAGAVVSSPPPPPSLLLQPGQVGQLRSYLDRLLEVNQVMNLTAVRDPQEAWQRHVEDSLALLPAIERHAAARGGAAALSLIDVGTGAGLPGLVLAVARPAWQVTLLDSLRKRCDFLEATAELLGLANVRVVWARAEEAGGRPELREAHDVATARAVAELRVLAELCLPLVRPGGVWVAAKGARPEEEVAAARGALSLLGGSLAAVEPVQSWAPEGQRTAVVVAKVAPTPRRYPRPPGTPAKKPL